MKAFYYIIGFISVVVYTILVGTIGYTLFLDDQLAPNLNRQVPGLFNLFLGMLLMSYVAFLAFMLNANRKVDVVYVRNRVGGKGSEETNGFDLENKGDETELSDVPIAMQKAEEIILSNQFNKKLLLEKFLRNICNYLQSSVGAVYITKIEDDQRFLEMAVSYAYYHNSPEPIKYFFGQGLVGQVAKNGKEIIITVVPEGYIKVVSGLGKASPSNLLIYPIKNEEEEVLAIIELASFKKFTKKDTKFLGEVALLLAKEIEANEYHSISL